MTKKDFVYLSALFLYYIFNVEVFNHTFTEVISNQKNICYEGIKEFIKDYE